MKIEWEVEKVDEVVVHWGSVLGRRLFKIDYLKNRQVWVQFAFDASIRVLSVPRAKVFAQKELDKWLENSKGD